MNARSVRPVALSAPAGPAVNSCSAYEIAESNELPLLNVARSVRSEWLCSGAEQVYVRFTNRWKAVILGGYAVGYIAIWIALAVPARTGRWIAVFASVPTTFTSAIYFLLLRYEVVCLVVRTYEFWFFSASNLVSAVLFALYLHDLRAVLALPVWFALQNNIFVDANVVFSKIFVSASVGMLFFIVFLLVAVSFNLIDAVCTFDLLHIDASRHLVVQDALLHGFSTQAIVLARNIYRRWTSPTRPHAMPHCASTITCVTLRARVKLHLINQGVTDVVNVLPRTDSIVRRAHGVSLVRLKLVPVVAQFRADLLLVPSIRGVIFALSAMRRRAIRTALLVIAYTGLSLTIVVTLSPNVRYANAIRVVSFACSLTFVTCLLMTTQRQLLRRLVFTFDFGYLSLQLIVVHACLCDMLGWGYSSLPVVTVWLWIQWVLTADAVTPIVKTKWTIRRQLPSIIMLFFIVSQVLVFVAIILEDNVELQNRVLVSVTIHGRLIEMRVIPMLLSRMVLLFGWSLKVLWRMWTLRLDELLMIQGGMTYMNLHRSRKIQSASTTEVSPN